MCSVLAGVYIHENAKNRIFCNGDTVTSFPYNRNFDLPGNAENDMPQTSLINNRMVIQNDEGARVKQLGGRLSNEY
jgi:hypothetical protein